MIINTTKNIRPCARFFARLVQRYERAMAGNCPYFPKLAFKKLRKIIHEKITSSSVNQKNDK